VQENRWNARLARPGRNGEKLHCLNPSVRSVKYTGWTCRLKTPIRRTLSRGLNTSPEGVTEGNGSTDYRETSKAPWKMVGSFNAIKTTAGVGNAVGTLQGSKRVYNSPKDTKWAPATVLYVNRVRNARMPKRREPQGIGVSVVVSARESLVHGEGRQAESDVQPQRYA